MSGFSFKQFQQLYDAETSEEQLDEIFGLFKNNAKIQKLRKDAMAGRQLTSAERNAKNSELDAQLKKFGASKAVNKDGIISDDELEDALDLHDRRRLSPDEKKRSQELADIRKKLGVKSPAVRK